MLLRLDMTGAPRWIEMAPGVRFLVDPWSSTIMGLARESARIDFMEHWLRPRRAAARALLVEGIAAGTIVDEDPDTLIDVLFGPIYHRALLTAMPLTADYVEALLRRVTA